MLTRAYNSLREIGADALQFILKTRDDLNGFASLIKRKTPGTNTLKEQLQYAWNGFKQSVDVATFLHQLAMKEDTRRIWMDSLKTNVIIFGSQVLLYQIVIKRGIKYLPYGETLPTEYVIELLASMYFTRLALNNFLTNSITNINLIGSAADDFPESLQDIQPCGCPYTSILKASCASSFYQIANYQFISFVQSKLPFGATLGLLPKALAIGQSFVEYKAGAKDICTMHRYENIIAPNAAYSLGLGLAYIFFLKMSKSTLSILCNIEESEFLDYALLQIINQYFIIQTFTNSKALPVNRPGGIDFFYPLRIAMEPVLGATADVISKTIIMLDTKETNSNLTYKLNRARQFPPIQLLIDLSLEKQFHSLENLTKTQAFYEFILLYGKSIKEAISYINMLRTNQITRLAGSLKDYIPAFLLSNDIKMALDILLGKSFDKTIDEAEQWVKTILEQVNVRVFYKDVLSQPLWDYQPKRNLDISKELKRASITTPPSEFTSIKPIIKKNPAHLKQAGSNHPTVRFFSGGMNKLIIAESSDVEKKQKRN